MRNVVDAQRQTDDPKLHCKPQQNSKWQVFLWWECELIKLRSYAIDRIVGQSGTVIPIMKEKEGYIRVVRMFYLCVVSCQKSSCTRTIVSLSKTFDHSEMIAPASALLSAPFLLQSFSCFLP